MAESESPARYDDLRAMFVNCTLKRSPDPSNTQGLIDVSKHILEVEASGWTRSGRSITTSRSACGRR
jgi:hypothetical protein